jgi:hypothetical protein
MSTKAPELVTLDRDPVPPAGHQALEPRYVMRTRITAGLIALAGGLAVAVGGPDPVAAQPPKTDKGPPPKFLYGHDLRVRPGGEKDFPKALKIGVEVFQDEATKATVGISEAGAVSVFPAGPVGADKTSKWQTAHDLKVRKAGEPEFTQKTKMWGVEVFRDLGSDRLLYVCESGSIAFAPVPGSFATDKGPKWHHALEPKVRSADQETFDSAKKFGLEVFKDENTGGLIYITETGAIATAAAPASPPDPKKVAPPKPAYGLVLRVRGAAEPEFTDKTKKIGVEVHEDPNANTLLYISETGSVAVVPKPASLLGGKGVTWKTAMNLRARKGGEKEFDKAKKYGIEVFQDNRTGHLLFITETGAIAVLTK